MLTLQEISSFAILIPLSISAIKLKTGDLKLRLFFLFLLFGAIVDGMGFIANKTNAVWSIHGYFLTVYLVYEAFFFLWVSSINFDPRLRNTLRKYLGFTFFLSFGLKIYFEFVEHSIVFSSFFSTFCLVVISFLSGFSLLRMSEQVDAILSFPWFWILAGIFLYSFGTFFIDALLYSQIIDRIWYTRNIINIIQYGFFVAGLLLLPRSTRP